MWAIRRTPSEIYVRDDAGMYWKADCTPIIDFGGLMETVHPPVFDYVFVPYEPPDMIFMGLPFGDRSRRPHSTVGTFPRLMRTASSAFPNTNTFPANSPINLYDVDRMATRNCGRLWDIGDICGRSRSTLSSIIARIVPERIPIVCVSGDHACTFDVATALTDVLVEPLTVWHFDAHFDRYSLPGAAPALDHGNFISYLERAGTFRIVHIGVRGLRSRNLVVDAEFDALPSSQFSLERFQQLVEAIPPTTSYLSVDMDCLDPRDFPWVDFPIPNGLPGRIIEEAIQCLFQSHHHIVAVDIVEANAEGNPDRGDYDWAVRILVAILEGLVMQRRAAP